MHHLLLYSLFLICFGAARVNAQPDTSWTARVTATGNPSIYNAVNHSSGDFIVVGETNPGLSSSNCIVSRITPSGVSVWTRTFGSTGADIANSCVELPDGDLVIAGCNSTNNVLLMKVTADGDSVTNRMYGTGGSTCANDLVLLQDGNLAVVGFGLGLDGLRSDLLLLKCDQNLDTLWTRKFGGSEVDMGYRIEERPDQSLLLGGSSRSSSGRDYELWLLHTDPNGMSISSTLFGNGGPEICNDLSDADTVIYIGGRTTVSGVNRAYIVKSNDENDTLFARSYTNASVEDQLRGIVARQTGGALCVGWTGTSWNSRQCWMFEVNSSGTEAWQWTFGPTGSGFYGLIPANGGGFLAYGQINESNSRKGYVVRVYFSKIVGTVNDFETGLPVVNASVKVIGTTLHAETSQSGTYEIPIANGTYSVTVSGECISRDTLADIIVEPDSLVHADFQVHRPRFVHDQSSINAVVQNGEETSVPFLISNSGNGPMEIGITTQTISPAGGWLTVSPDTALVQAGDSLVVQVHLSPDTSNDGMFDFNGYLHLTTNSCPNNLLAIPVLVSVLDAETIPSALPQDFSLAAYPNPFNSTTNIDFDVPRTSMIRLEVYDITGRKVAILADRSFAPGSYHTKFDAGNLSSGIYIARITGDYFSASQKVVLIK